jgi:hypothetical protein
MFLICSFNGIGKMRIWSRILILVVAAAVFAGCERKPATPLDTFKTYVKAFKQKDTDTMKLLLSASTIKMHEQEAKAQGTTVDEILKRETMVGDAQRSVEYRNEKIEGDKASLQIKNLYGSWETLPFIREDGVWKIDKQGYFNQMVNFGDESDKKLDEIIRGAGTPGQTDPPGGE